MTYDDVMLVLADLVERMPKGYPRPRLVMHESSEALAEFDNGSRHGFHVANGFPPAMTLAYADHQNNAIHIQRMLLMDGITKVTRVLLHELGHLRQAQKHGVNSNEYFDEGKANAFERRWSKKIEQDGGG